MISIQTELITSNDRPFGRPIIFTDKNSQRYFWLFPNGDAMFDDNC